MSIFQRVNKAAIPVLYSIVSQWLPNGRQHGNEYIATNPTRNDSKAGSFSVNLKTGKWADFATGDKGGDIISLAAYLTGQSQYQAAKCLSKMLGLSL